MKCPICGKITGFDGSFPRMYCKKCWEKVKKRRGRPGKKYLQKLIEGKQMVLKRLFLFSFTDRLSSLGIERLIKTSDIY